MHELYSKMWKISVKINTRTNIQKKFVFMLLDMILWCIVGMIIYLMMCIIPSVGFSLVTMFVIAGYAAVVMGFFGSAMYILRNTEPEELK